MGEEVVLLKAILEIISSFGVIGILGLLIVLLYRGDLLPRNVWEELTKSAMREMVQEFKEALKEIIRRGDE